MIIAGYRVKQGRGLVSQGAQWQRIRMVGLMLLVGPQWVGSAGFPKNPCCSYVLLGNWGAGEWER